MRRILGDKPADDAPIDADGNAAASATIDGQTVGDASANVVSPTPSTSGDVATSVNGLSVDAVTDDSTPPSLLKTTKTENSEATDFVAENSLGISKECHLEQNGFHPQLLDRASEDSDSKKLPRSSGAAAAAEKEPETLAGGGFGFNASSLKNRNTGRQIPERSAVSPPRRSDVPERSSGFGEDGNGSYVSHETYDSLSWAKDSLLLEDEEDLLNLKDHHRQSSADVDGTATR